MNDHPMTRRGVLKAIAGTGAAGALSGVLAGCATKQSTTMARTPPAASRQRALRLAHMTDFHIQPEKGAGEGSARCLHHVQSLADKPSLIITGGDHIMDGVEKEEARTRELWELWARTVRNDCSIPVRHALGNHDIWGWNKGKSKTTGSEARWGKQWALDALGEPSRYYSFDRSGWHIVVLDSIHVHPENPSGYIGKLDDPQFDWLERDLAAASRAGGPPVMVVSHIPILSAIVLVPRISKGDDQLASKGVQMARDIPAGLMHVDAHRLRMLFRQNPNVKLCLSGHLHRTDRVDYEGVTYLCSGAVSGSWWDGPNDLTREGYNVVDLYSDGTFGYEYIEYGWTARA
ncbi:MAG TPA: metallophosphoesterase [Phycisphaerales bacterium]|nr:metallophosphoesterase [Phycisphaerales bacterium]